MHRTFNRPCSVGEMADCINPHQFRGYKIMSSFRREEQPVTFTIGLFGHYDSDAHYLPLWSPVSFEPGK